jgi:hypothetical protein
MVDMSRNRQADLKSEVVEMNHLVKYFLDKGISPNRALQIMAFTIFTILKLGESLDRWN